MSTTLVVPLLLMCEWPGTISFLMVPVFVLGSASALIGGVVLAIIFTLKRKPRRAASVLLSVLAPVILWLPIHWTADCIHLALTVGLGVGQLQSNYTPGFAKPAAYDWSTGLAGGPSTFLVYDQDDALARPYGIPQSLPGIEPKTACTGASRRLIGHYYLCTIS